MGMYSSTVIKQIFLFVMSFKILNFGQIKMNFFKIKKRSKIYYLTNVNVCSYIDFSV